MEDKKYLEELERRKEELLKKYPTEKKLEKYIMGLEKELKKTIDETRMTELTDEIDLAKGLLRELKEGRRKGKKSIKSALYERAKESLKEYRFGE